MLNISFFYDNYPTGHHSKEFCRHQIGIWFTSHLPFSSELERKITERTLAPWSL